MVTRNDVLRQLPRLQGRRDMIEYDQDTKDIVREVLDAHQFFASDYDKIAGLFDEPDNALLYNDLFDFCKKNIRYVIEKDRLQTTRSPGALLQMGYGDCKHYAGFIGGVLDALKRKGRKINWKYRFASYDPDNSRPQHVFVVATDNGNETWIDPVLSSLDKRSPSPNFKQDKKPDMLQRIYGAPATMGTDILTEAANRWKAMIKQAEAEMLPKYESGSYYMAKIYGDTPDIHKNPPIKFFVDGEPYKLPVPAEVLRNSYDKTIKENTYTLWSDYILANNANRNWAEPIRPPQGLTVQYPTTWKGKPVPENMLIPVVQQDGSGIFVFDEKGNRIFFTGMNADQTNKKLIENGNLLLDLLVCAVGCLQMAYQPYPDAQNFQRFYDNMLNHRDDNFLYAREIKTVAGSIIKGIGDAIAAIGKGFVKFIGIIPRNAFLLLVKLNVGGMATNLANQIKAGNGPHIQSKWEGFGGAYSTLVNCIDQGKTKSRIFGMQDTISGDGMGEMTVAAALASAAPVIALLAQFLKKIGDDKTDALVDTAVDQMNKLLTAAGEDPIAVGDELGGKPVQIPTPGGGVITIPKDPTAKNKGIGTWIQENPVAAGAIGVGVGYGIYKVAKASRRR